MPLAMVKISQSPCRIEERVHNAACKIHGNRRTPSNGFGAVKHMVNARWNMREFHVLCKSQWGTHRFEHLKNVIRHTEEVTVAGVCKEDLVQKARKRHLLQKTKDDKENHAYVRTMKMQSNA